MFTSPCKDCKNRVVGCHSSCEAYIKWKAEVDGNNHIRKLEDEGRRYAIEKMKKIKSRYKKK